MVAMYHTVDPGMSTMVPSPDMLVLPLTRRDDPVSKVMVAPLANVTFFPERSKVSRAPKFRSPETSYGSRSPVAASYPSSARMATPAKAITTASMAVSAILLSMKYHLAESVGILQKSYRRECI